LSNVLKKNLTDAEMFVLVQFQSKKRRRIKGGKPGEREEFPPPLPIKEIIVKFSFIHRYSRAVGCNLLATNSNLKK